MNREEILQASLSRYGHKYQFKTRKAFERGARWMQEQMIKQARSAFCRYCQFDCERHPHDDCTLLQEYVQTIKGER